MPAKKKGYRFVLCFLGVMAFLGIACWKLTDWATPRVSVTSPRFQSLYYEFEYGGLVSAGNVVVSIPLAQDEYFPAGETAKLVADNLQEPVEGTIREKSYENGAVVCILEPELTSFLEGQPCTVLRKEPIGDYPMVLPSECVWQEGGKAAVYLLEETSSFFSPLIVRRVSVNVVADDGRYLAVEGGLTPDALVVQYASGGLSDEQAVALIRPQ